MDNPAQFVEIRRLGMEGPRTERQRLFFVTWVYRRRQHDRGHLVNQVCLGHPLEHAESADHGHDEVKQDQIRKRMGVSVREGRFPGEIRDPLLPVSCDANVESGELTPNGDTD